MHRLMNFIRNRFSTGVKAFVLKMSALEHGSCGWENEFGDKTRV